MTSLYRFLALFLIVSAVGLAACSSPPEAPNGLARNATITVVLADGKVVQGGILHYNMTITNTGADKSFDAAVEHRIFSAPLGRVVKTEGEIVRLENWIYKDKAIPLPPDAPTGSYQLFVAITYGVNETRETGGYFEVVPKVEEVVKESASESASKAPPKSPSLRSDAKKTTVSPVSSSPATGSATTPVAAAKGQNVAEDHNNAPKNVVIEHKERAFVPSKVTIEPGTTVVWINRDKTSAVVDGSGFHSDPLGANAEFRHSFAKPGIFDFYSHLTKAGGTIIVEDPDHPLQFKRDPMSFKGGLNS